MANRTGTASTAIAAVFVALCLLLPETAVAAGLDGLTIEQAIERLRADGTEIIYSSDVVKPWMRGAQRTAR